MAKGKDERDNPPNSAGSDDIENSPRSVWEAEKAGEGYLIAEHIWFASVVFPLFAGAFGPMASAFGICALAESWRVADVTKASDGMLVGSAVKDPRW
jgi:potassium channel subfamily K